MGICSSSMDEDSRLESLRIDRKLAKQRKQMQDEVTLLLLGTGGSGKSTVAKQLHLLFAGDFSDEERTDFLRIIHHNIIFLMRMLVKELERDNVKLPHNLLDDQKLVSDLSLRNPLTTEVANAIERLWNTLQVQEVFYAKSSFVGHRETWEYLRPNIKKYAESTYTVTKEDILRARHRTTGVRETSFCLDDLMFSVVDVGGQKSERRKWLHCFTDIKCCIFCVGTSDYDLMCEEIASVNAIHDSLSVFGDVVNNELLMKHPIIVFYNKDDILRKKVQKVPLTVCFPDYTGPQSYEAVLSFIKTKYNARITTAARKKNIYEHATCAIDGENVLLVFAVVRKQVLSAVLQDVGLSFHV